MPAVTNCGEGSQPSPSSEEMAADTSSCFSVPHLRQFVERGQWKDAVEYLLRFLPPGLESLKLEAQILRRFLVAHMALANILTGTKEGDVLADKYRKYRDHGSSVCHGIIRLRSIMLTALHAKQQLRDSLDWECVWRKASEIVDDLACRTPELKNLVLKTGGPMKQHNLFPIGFSSSNRRPHKKQPHRIRASVLAKGYLHKKRSLLRSSRSQESHDDLLNKAMNCVADAVDKSLKAGKHPQLNQDHPLQPSGREGPAKNHTMSSASYAGGTVAPVQRTMLGTFPGTAKITGIPSMANAGATVAPVLQTMIGSFPSTSKITGNPSMSNAVTRHVLSSGAPFSRMMFSSPVLRTMSGSLITPPKNSRVSLSTNTGTTVAPVSQVMFGPMPGPTTNPEIPSMANAAKLASHVQSSVVPVSQTVFGCLTNPDKSSTISLMTDAGTSEHSSQEGFNAKCARQGIITRKHTREELSTDEQDLPSKLQRARGAFNEASLAEYVLDADTCD